MKNGFLRKVRPHCLCGDSSSQSLNGVGVISHREGYAVRYGSGTETAQLLLSNEPEVSKEKAELMKRPPLACASAKHAQSNVSNKEPRFPRKSKGFSGPENQARLTEVRITRFSWL